MATDALIIPGSRAPTWLDQAVFLAFLLLAFVGLSPFSPPPPAALAGAVSATGAGDLARQLCYLAIFAAIVFGALRQQGAHALRALPVLLLVLLAW